VAEPADMREVAGRVLLDAAREASANAHAPYSHFGVGAAALLDDGQLVTGANFENASYGLSLCAETVTLATANSQGRLRGIVALAVIGGALARDGTIAGSALVTPCGRCRQVIHEAAQLGGRDIDIYCASADGSAFAHFRASELLPHAFGPADLGLD